MFAITKLHFALTKTTAISTCFSAASLEHQNSGEIDKVAALYWLHFRSGRGILIELGIVQCGYPLRKNDASLRAIAQNSHEILAGEVVGIHKIKIAAKYYRP